MSVHPAETQISLGICPVWSKSSLCARWVAKDPRFLHADSEYSDQTGRMPRLIWVFAGHTCHFVGFVTRRLVSLKRKCKKPEISVEKSTTDLNAGTNNSEVFLKIYHLAWGRESLSMHFCICLVFLHALNFCPFLFWCQIGCNLWLLHSLYFSFKLFL